MRVTAVSVGFVGRGRRVTVCGIGIGIGTGTRMARYRVGTACVVGGLSILHICEVVEVECGWTDSDECGVESDPVLGHAVWMEDRWWDLI